MARRILLADDSVTAQNMGRRILTDAGYEVVTVNNGSAALKKIAENRPDIIVLDVYMPGYGGLEVCQRVKEAAETARIPVLLTVGKLEPFKPDEARRVKADAFIVKPFEATELLTALTKLEDKIVAGPQPQKPARFAKALAAVEQSAGERFGDKETGWKNRLTIPGPNLKPQSEPEAPETVVGPARDFERSETARPVEARPEFERPMPAGLPADITPEEIAAITAAAASFAAKSGQSAAVPESSAPESAAITQAEPPETAAVPSSEPEPPTATLASATETELETAAPVEVAAEAAPAEAETVTEATATSETKIEEPAATELPAPAAESDSAPRAASEAPVHVAEEPPSHDVEVMAALASLAPSNGHGSESVPSAPAAIGTDQGVVAGAPVVAALSGATGPRWIAELVAVTLEESAPTLEQEMEQVMAARSADEAARNDRAAAAAAEAQTPAAPVAIEPAAADAGGVADAVAAAESAPEPMAVAESVVAASIPESPVQTAEPEVAKDESAFAAAAAAGSTAGNTTTVEAVSSATVSPEVSENAPVASVETAPPREAELAAAWQNWKQIRESFVKEQPSAPVAEAAAETRASQEEPAPAAEAEEAERETEEVEAAASDAPGESTAIASIVDTMLAELRPKLVEEIAKKMSSEKKEKEKEKKKRK